MPPPLDSGEEAMVLRGTLLVTVALATLGLSACQSARLSGITTRNSTVAEPLEPAPTGTVTGEQLPPPATPDAQPTDPNAFPDAPGADAAATTKPVEVASASAPDVSPGSVAGVWSASIGGQACKIATPQTKYGSGYRAGPLKCPEPIAGVKSWSAAGKQLVLYDANGSPVARLYQSGAGRFDGQTTGGQPISLTR